MKAALLLSLSFFAVTACRPWHSSPERFEITGTKEERVAKATALLAKYCPLPGALLDAHIINDVKDNSGGMVPGPSDSWLSGVILVPSEDLPKWRAVLSPKITMSSPPWFTSRMAQPPWWPPEAAFNTCEFYTPKKLTNQSGGFVAIDPSASAIYFSTTKL
jgi:hypothetical protein